LCCIQIQTATAAQLAHAIDSELGIVQSGNLSIPSVSGSHGVIIPVEERNAENISEEYEELGLPVEIVMKNKMLTTSA
jgi:hypothetical protein